MKAPRIFVVPSSVVLIVSLFAGCGGTPTLGAVPTQGTESTSATPTVAVATKAVPTATSVSPMPTPVAPKVGGTLVYALPGEPDTLDNQRSLYSLQKVISNWIGGSLLTKEPTEGKIVPYLVEKWTVSDSGLVWDFVLKRGIRFHDGTPCTAKDYVYTLQRALDPETKSTSTGSALKGTRSVEAVDDYTLRLTLETPSPALLQSLCQTSFFMPLSKAYVEKMGDQYGRAPMSVGPFKFKEWRTGERIVIERNPDFAWGPDYARGGPPYIQTIEFRIIPEPATIIAGLEAGEVGFAAVEAKDVANLEATGQFVTIDYLAQGVIPVVFFNTSKAPFNDVRVRQAFNLAVDRPALIKVVALGRAIVQYGPISISVPGYWPGVEKIGYGLDLDRAKALMKEAGYSVGAGGTFEKEGQPLKLSLLAPSNLAEMGKAAEVLQAQFISFGAQVDIVKEENAQANATFRSGAFDFGVTGVEWPDPAAMYLLYRSSFVGALNYSRIEDPDLDNLLDAMLAASNQDDYFAGARNVQQYMVEKAYIIPMYTPKYASMLRSTVKGYTWSEITGQLDLFDAYIAR